MIEFVSEFWVYCLFALIPIYFIFESLFNITERYGKNKSAQSSSPVRPLISAIFTMIAITGCFLIDLNFSASILAALPFQMPRIVLQVALFPFVMYIFALVTGGSKPPSLKRDERIGR